MAHERRTIMVRGGTRRWFLWAAAGLLIYAAVHEVIYGGTIGF